MKKPMLIALGGKPARARQIKDKDMQEFYRGIETDVLARTLWGEARGEGPDGMEAVACVIFNRVKIANENGGRWWWGGNIIQVCQKPYQFSCWNRSDPNFQKLQAVDETDLYFATALRIARRAIAGSITDTTNGATHYHAKTATPYWARGEVPVAVIGNHIFYRVMEG
ncbi:MAG: cell wall hydrolase [Alphaproteobacteria bacterium]